MKQQFNIQNYLKENKIVTGMHEGSTSNYTYDNVFDDITKTSEFKTFRTKIKSLVSKFEDSYSDYVDKNDLKNDRDFKLDYGEMFNELVSYSMKNVLY